jgi:hypothetical protein
MFIICDEKETYNWLNSSRFALLLTQSQSLKAHIYTMTARKMFRCVKYLAVTVAVRMRAETCVGIVQDSGLPQQRNEGVR